MRAVFAGDMAEITANAEIVIDARDRFVVKIKVAPIRHAPDALADDVVDALESFVVKIV